MSKSKVKFVKGGKSEAASGKEKPVKKPAYVHFTGDYKGTPMFYISKKGNEDADFHPFHLSVNKARMLIETPGALDALKKFVAENAE